jgi:hypothetical protein
MNIPIQIGANTFKSKSDAKNHARAIMERYSVNQIITGTDDIFLRDLIAIHPEADQKIGCGIAHFTSQIDPVWKTTRHFLIVRTDGSSTDFSFHTCIDGNNHRKDVLHALRHAIAEQVVYFARCAFICNPHPSCPYTGEILSPANCHVDHSPPETFLNLVSCWMKQERLGYSDLQLVDNDDNQWVRVLRDDTLSSSWQRFHITNANLRIISPVANLSHVKRNRPQFTELFNESLQ